MIPSPSTRDNSRGQVLIITALIISITVIGSVVFLNAASVTDRRQAAGVSDYSQDSTDVVIDIRQNAEQAIRHINFNNDSYPDYADKETALQTTINSIEKTYIRSASGVSLTVESTNQGKRLTQQTFRNLTAPDGSTDWTAVDSAENVRSFSLEVDGEELATDGSGNEFTVNIGLTNGTTRTYTLAENASGYLVIRNNGDKYATSVNSTNTATVAFSHQTVNGDRFDNLPRTSEVQNINFENADNVHTRLDLVADGGNVGSPGNAATSQPCDNPGNACDEDTADTDAQTLTEYPAIYSANITVQLNNPSSSLDTTIEVAPQLGYQLDT